MKNPLPAVLIPALVILSLLFSCSKDSSGDSTPKPPRIDSLEGTWETTNWFDPGDTVRITFTKTTKSWQGVFSYMNAKAALTGFTVGDIAYDTIGVAGSDSTYGAVCYYKWGPSNAMSGSTYGGLILKNNKTVLYAHQLKDPINGIVPKEHYFQRK